MSKKNPVMSEFEKRFPKPVLGEKDILDEIDLEVAWQDHKEGWTKAFRQISNWIKNSDRMKVNLYDLNDFIDQELKALAEEPDIDE